MISSCKIEKCRIVKIKCYQERKCGYDNMRYGGLSIAEAVTKILLQIAALKNFGTFSGRHLCLSPFARKLQAASVQLC